MSASATLPTPETTAPEEPGFDLFLPLRSTANLSSPYPMYGVIRTVRPVLPIPLENWEGPGAWLLTRYADVHQALRDPRLSVDRTSAPLIRENLDRLPDFLRQSAQGLRSMLVMDPPDHTRVRKLANKAFTPRRIDALASHIEALVDDLLGRASARGRFDLIRDFAEPLPAVVIAELLGVPPEDHRRFRDWSSGLIAAIGSPDPALRQQASRCSAELFDYLRGAIAERRRAPQDDLISALVEAQEDRDALSDEELLANTNLLLIAGHETTTNLIGNGMLALSREPEQWRRLCDQPELAPTAVEELLRFDGPVQSTLRVAREDIEIDGHALEKGSLALLSIGSANHDPEIFDEPDRLDITRDPNPHLGFGFGTHFCMGAPLARLEAQLAFRALAQRFPDIDVVDDDPEYRPNPVLRGLRSLEVVVR